jgi:putative ABC transport system substrate-binding protein
MKWRDFLVLVGIAAAAWPCAGRAQQSAMPVIGFLNSASHSESKFMAAFHKGLNEGGYVEGVNVAIEYRWAEGKYDRLPALANDLVQRQVALIVSTGGTQSARAAKAATSTIPILFISGGDPVSAGLVGSINRPGGNATGASVLSGVLMAKRLELLRGLLPKGAVIAALHNPTALGAATSLETKEMQAATRTTGQPVIVLEASSDAGLDAALNAAVQQQAGGLIVGSDPFFTSRRDLLVEAAARHSLPAMYPWPEYVEAGGLMSYGPSITDAYHKVGIYAGRILSGAKPGDLPVEASSRVELIFNLKTARALRLNVPRIILARADEIID